VQILAGRDTQQLFSRQLGIKPVVTHQTSGVECAAERDVQQDQAVAITFSGTFNPACLMSHNWLYTKEGGLPEGGRLNGPWGQGSC